MITETEISEVMLTAIESANESYVELSENQWISDSAIEGYVVGKIAESLFKHARKKDNTGWVSMEVAFNELKKMAKPEARRGPAPKILGENFRADIVYWSELNKPRGIIEVKRFWNKANCSKDLDRLKALIEHYGTARSGSLTWGALAVFLPHGPSSQSTLEEVHQKIKDIAKEHSSDAFIITPRFSNVISENAPVGDPLHGWSRSSVCLYVKRRPSKKSSKT